MTVASPKRSPAAYRADGERDRISPDSRILGTPWIWSFAGPTWFGADPAPPVVAHHAPAVGAMHGLTSDDARLQGRRLRITAAVTRSYSRSQPGVFEPPASNT